MRPDGFVRHRRVRNELEDIETPMLPRGEDQRQRRYRHRHRHVGGSELPEGLGASEGAGEAAFEEILRHQRREADGGEAREFPRGTIILIVIFRPVRIISPSLQVDVYVVISCAMNEIYENREFYKPIVTPFDVEAALNPRRSPGATFSYDYNTFLQRSEEITDDVKNDIVDSDVSLITGNVRRRTEDVAESNGGTDLVVREDGKVALNSTYGAGYLSSRSWKGLEQTGSAEPHLAQKGRSGIAYGYENEKTEGM